MEALCEVTGSGAQAGSACWRASLTLCGATPCNTAALPPYGDPGSTLITPGEPAEWREDRSVACRHSRHRRPQPPPRVPALPLWSGRSNVGCRCCSLPAPLERLIACRPSWLATAGIVDYGGTPPKYSSYYGFTLENAWQGTTSADTTNYCEQAWAQQPAGLPHREHLGAHRSQRHAHCWLVLALPAPLPRAACAACRALRVASATPLQHPLPPLQTCAASMCAAPRRSCAPATASLWCAPS